MSGMPGRDRGRTVGDVLGSHAQACPDATFLIDVQTEVQRTYAEAAARSDGMASALLRRGVRHGDRMCVVLPNGIDLVELLLASLKIGAIFAPINPVFTAAETGYILEHAEPRLVCTNEALVEGLGTRAAAEALVLDGPADGWFTVGEAPPADRAPAPADPGLLLYTSGSTGRSKGALITHDNLLSNATEIAAWLRVAANDRMACIMPLFHANALVIGVTVPLCSGASTVIAERFSARAFWPLVDRVRPTMFGSVATMLTRLLAAGSPPAGLRRDSVRFALCGSAPVPVEVMRRFDAVFGIPVIEGYGLTECTCRATFNPVDDPRPGSAGKALGNELRVVAADGSRCAPAVVGEVVLRGRNVMAGYFRAPEATREALGGGWLRSGDLGYLTEDGFLYLVGRKSDMIIRGGENVYPREIEDVIYRLPGVREVAVVGVPDPDYGEAVVACVTLHEGPRPTPARIAAHCREHLAAFKCPTAVHLLTEMPKGPTGKLLKRALAERFGAASRGSQP
jgi:acyl-CoA synthetase (AMP-forming)/AMP-acid ligase II